MFHQHSVIFVEMNSGTQMLRNNCWILQRLTITQTNVCTIKSDTRLISPSEGWSEVSAYQGRTVVLCHTECGLRYQEAYSTLAAGRRPSCGDHRKNTNILERIVNGTIANISLSLTPENTRAVLLNGRKGAPCIQLQFEGMEMEANLFVSYLRIILHSDLTGNIHGKLATREAPQANLEMCRILQRKHTGTVC